MSGIGKYNLVALDSNVFIYHFEKHPEFAKHTYPIFEKLAKDQIKAVTSIISIIETLSFPASKKEVKNLLEAFIKAPNLETKEVDYEVAQKAAELRRTLGIRLPDSIQLATALTSGAKAFITNDQNLKKFKKLPIILLTEIT